MKLIELTNGKLAQVDDEDFKYLNQFKWYAGNRNGIYYARRGNYNGNNMGVIYMHRSVMGLKTGDRTTVDHIDGNGLNNQRSNLRLCSQKENSRNKSASRNGTSKYLGVSFRSKNKKWCAQIESNYKVKHIGYYETEIEAAKERDKHAIRLHGKFAKLNFKI